MNYVKIYKNLVTNCDIGDYLEKHHIIPKSIFNNIIAREILSDNIKDVNQKENLVHLTGRKHFIAHKLLVKIFKNVNSDAFIRMSFAMNFLNSRLSNGKEYEWCKKIHSKVQSQHRTGKPSNAKGCKWSEEARQHKSDICPTKGKTYEEIYGEEKAKELKEKRKKGSTGRVLSEESRAKISRKAKERQSTPEFRKKMSEAKKKKKD